MDGLSPDSHFISEEATGMSKVSEKRTDYEIAREAQRRVNLRHNINQLRLQAEASERAAIIAPTEIMRDKWESRAFTLSVAAGTLARQLEEDAK